jgi:hypothetical protein
MKGIQGLILALGLGIAGAMFNWAYLAQKSSEVAKVNFIGINRDVVVNAGEKLTEDHLVPVGIPADSVGNLKDFAYLYSVRQSVIAMPVRRTLAGGTLLLKDDLTTPRAEMKFDTDLPDGQEERGLMIPVDTKTFIPSLVEPGEIVDFFVVRGGMGMPTPAGAAAAKDGQLQPQPQPQPQPGKVEIIGSFKVLSLGNRLGSPDVMKAAGVMPTQENVMTVSIKMIKGEMEPKAQKLCDTLQQTGFRQLGILLRPKKTEAK